MTQNNIIINVKLKKTTRSILFWTGDFCLGFLMSYLGLDKILSANKIDVRFVLVVIHTHLHEEDRGHYSQQTYHVFACLLVEHLCVLEVNEIPSRKDTHACMFHQC